jgi:hypothetical protein
VGPYFNIRKYYCNYSSNPTIFLQKVSKPAASIQAFITLAHLGSAADLVTQGGHRSLPALLRLAMFEASGKIQIRCGGMPLTRRLA